MGLALYRKYRPKGLVDVVGQDHIVTTLKNALKTGKISHAYLFTGPRGVGKTSVARILAHEINGLAYTDDSMHLDIIEIDAASNRRIDEIRDLRDKVHIAPTSAKYKVYIIDEVHMLTREAFNALLKTLEEPPAHVVFILATTEAHKVPDTIASRTQRFTFKPISREDTTGHLRELAKKEDIAISDEALGVLADHAGGSFRDSINLLDQIVGSGDKIEKEDLEAIVGLPNPDIINALYAAVREADIPVLSQTVADARIGGIHAGLLAKALGELFRQSIIENGKAPDNRTVTLLRQLIETAGARDAYASLELALFEYAAVATTSPQKAPSEASVKVNVPELKKSQPPALETELPKKENVEEASDAAVEVDQTAQGPVPEDAFWDELLIATKKHHNTLYGMLRMARPQLENDELVLAFSFAFHQKQMSQAANQKHIADAASSLLGRPIKVKSVHQKDTKPLAEKPRSSPQAKKPVASSHLNDVKNIFNGAELLE